MKIGIDARFVGPQGTGLGKYTEKLILNLAKIDKKNNYIIFLKKDNWSFLNLNNAKNFLKVLADVPWYSAQEQYKMPGIFKSKNLDLLHVPHFNVPFLYRDKFVVTIHDLIHHKFQEGTATTKNPIMFKLKKFGYKKIIENAIYKSQKIITPSNFVKDDILKNFKVEPNKIVVTYEAAEEEYSTVTINNKQETGNFLLYVGNAYPHKNLSKLLDAMKIIASIYSSSERSESRSSRQVYTERNRSARTITKLVIVSPRDVFTHRLTEEIKKRQLESVVEVKGYLEPQELSKLFQKASAYVFPSLSEGFGIPGLNAMASGLPVVASNIPVLKEIYGDAAIYFDPEDPQDIASKTRSVLGQGDAKLRTDLVNKGIAQAKKYSWQKMALQTLHIYEGVKKS